MFEDQEATLDTQATVGTSPVQILPAQAPDKQLIELTITNISTGGQIVSMQTGSPGASGDGVVMYPTGSSSESLDARYTPSNDARFLIADNAGATVAIHARVGTKRR